MSEQQQQKKVILVSGATGYLGSEIAKKLSESGFSIAALYHHTSEETVEKLIGTFSGSGHALYKVDLGSQDNIAKTIQVIEEKQGSLYGVVHAAWTKSERKQLSACTKEEIEKEFNGNVLNSFNLLSFCGKVFKKHKEGIIIGITTAGIVIPEAAKNLGTYILGKNALQGILFLLKEELYPDVKVYSVAPGFMEGGMNKDVPKAFVEMIKQKSFSKKITNAGEVASTIVSLISGNREQGNDMTIVIAPEYNKN